MNEEHYQDALRVELERRIAEISGYTDEAFGRIGQGEWALFLVLAVVLPLLCVWSFA